MKAVVIHAAKDLRIEEREGFADFIWRHAPPPKSRPRAMGEVPGQTEASATLSKALKKEGFSFCGPTIVYAFMQASGLVNDHLESCPHG